MTIAQTSLPAPKELAQICAQAAESKKATDISVIDIADVIGISEYFVICSARSDRQVHAIAENIQNMTHTFSVDPIGIEGMRQNEWILLDYGSVVVHIFLEEARGFYRIERLFKDMPEVSWRSLNEAAG